VFLGTVFASGAADAAVTVNINQVGSDVIATASGSLDLTGLTFLTSGVLDDYGITPNWAFFGTGDPGTSDAYQGYTGPTSWGSGGWTPSSSSSGTIFALNAGEVPGTQNLFLQPGYVSGSSISSTSTWLGQSLASLGLATGTYVYTTPSDTITMIVGTGIAAGVPEPASWAMMLVGFGAIGWTMRRRQLGTALRSV